MTITKVIVEVQLDFSEESDNVLRTLFSIAEELLDKNNIWVEIIPVHLWFTNPLEAEVSDLPKVFINGKLRFIGRAPNRRELIQAVLEHAGLPPARADVQQTYQVNMDFDGGLPEASLIED